MIQHKSVLVVADNSGAHTMYVTHVFGGSTRKFGYIGDIVKAVIKKADPTAMVKEGEQVLAVIVRCHKETRRIDGSYIRFDDNAGVLIDTAVDKNPRGTRIFGPIARELKEKGFNKIISMAGEVL